MNVYVVTAGDYSDYHIVQIFTDRTKAHLFSLLDSDMRVEEYVTDDKELTIRKGYLLVSYNYRYGQFYDVTLTGRQVKPKITNEWRNPFVFTIPLSNERVFKNITRYGKNSKVILKIAQDKFAEYCYEHNTSKEELIRKQDDKLYRKVYRYNLATTSSNCHYEEPFNLKKEVSEKVTTVLKQRIADGEPLPLTEELETIYYSKVAEVKKEHEQN